MSYILDALRRADAERERGAVPGLHSQAQAAPALSVAAAPAGWLLAIGAFGGMLLVAAVAWLLLERATPVAGPAAATASAAASIAAPTPVPASAPAPAPTAAPAPATLRAAPVVAAPGAATRPIVASPHATAAVAPSGATAGAPPTAPSVATPAAPPAAAASSAAVTAVVRYEHLPESIRRELPPLAFGGAIYSPNPASRMLLVGGQLLHEGDTAAPGLVLEQIRPHSAVLRWKGLRYEMPL